MRRSLFLIILAVLSGCAGRHNWLASAGEEAHRVEELFWVLLVGAAIIWTGVIGAAVYAQRRQIDPSLEKQARRFIVWGGAVLPSSTIATVTTGMPISSLASSCDRVVRPCRH